MNDIYMNEALCLAQTAVDMGEIPVGAVVVRLSDGQIVGRGHNKCEKGRSPLLHAELIAIEDACKYLGGWRLDGCVMYVTLEPCMMCAGGIINSRINTVYYGTKDTGGRGAAHLLKNAVYIENTECAGILKDFFAKRRMTMDSLKLTEAVTDDQLHRVDMLADHIWHEYFPSIISVEQVDHMMNKFNSFKAMKENIAKEGYKYYIIKKGSADLGYTAIKPDGEKLFLSKLYLKAEERSKGYSRQVLEIHKAYAREHGFKSIWLTVNKGNDIAIRAYKGLGFELIGQGVTDIGGGFVMDDYYFGIGV